MTPKPPKHLQPATRRWWSTVVHDYDLGQHHVRLLTLASESYDRCRQARLALAKDGITYVDRFGQPRARPEVAIERDSRVAFARLLRELALDVEEPAEITRSPLIRGNANRRFGGLP